MRTAILLATTFTAICALGFQQSVAVKGRLICHDKPAAGVRIKMYDKDIVVDTKLDDKETDANGEFLLSGGDTEITTIDPRVNIYHDCDDDWTPCQRRLTIGIPDKYVTNGKNPTMVSLVDFTITEGDFSNFTFDLGVIQLAGKYSGETRDCIHRHK